MRHKFKITLLLFIIFIGLALFSACTNPPETEVPATPALTADPTLVLTAVPPPTIESPSPALSPTLPPAPTETPPPSPSPTAAAIRFAVIGDYGEGSQAEQDVAALVKGWSPDFIITTGDNNYPSGSPETIDHHIGKYYNEYIHPYLGAYGAGAAENRFFPTLGNHDWDTNGAQAYFDYFTLPGNERYYDFVWGPAHFFALDSDSREPDGVGASTPQAMWLQGKLAASTSTWKIVYMHHPPYSSGTHGPVDWMIWPFREWGASVVLSGHDHVYERLLVDGLTYFINGLGGGPIYSFLYYTPYSQVRFNDDYGAMLVVADAAQITFQFITRQGVVVDTLQLVR
jgi:hypothetical protein